jgi:hypothetical protein
VQARAATCAARRVRWAADGDAARVAAAAAAAAAAAGGRRRCVPRRSCMVRARDDPCTRIAAAARPRAAVWRPQGAGGEPHRGRDALRRHQHGARDRHCRQARALWPAVWPALAAARARGRTGGRGDVHRHAVDRAGGHVCREPQRARVQAAGQGPHAGRLLAQPRVCLAAAAGRPPPARMPSLLPARSVA